MFQPGHWDIEKMRILWLVGHAMKHVPVEVKVESFGLGRNLAHVMSVELDQAASDSAADVEASMVDAACDQNSQSQVDEELVQPLQWHFVQMQAEEHRGFENR